MIDKIKTIHDLANLLYFNEDELISLQKDEHYHVFQIPKPGTNEKRTIETPIGKLKIVLDKLSDALQWLYYEHKTDAAYGYVRTPKHETDKRNIYTNAHQHIGMNYLLNIDFHNFFYQVDKIKVLNIFNDFNWFSFYPDTELFLTNLVTYRDRLPMGSPTSPPLSNFATILLDNDLLKWARMNGFVYTRYVDDLSFSSASPITDNHFKQLLQILHSHRFEIDDHKTKWFGKKDKKEITGLIVDKTVNIPDEFISEFEKSICKLKEVCSYSHQLPDHHVFEWIEKMKQILHGRLAFVCSVYGKNHPISQKLFHEIEHINDCNPMEESISWRYAGYQIH